ncbi:Uncharacterized protein TCM_026532 [Theobroma cacao]|uniref:Uncharacterized protein n=1 Tax=Theobroma cacao TaxID=3641 RepID=A0A061F2M8_THECC|nr:Uncharacterized protein TCM_026532 [Theobroma cacao]
MTLGVLIIKKIEKGIQSTDSQKGLISGKKKDRGEGKRLLIKATKRIFGFAT